MKFSVIIVTLNAGNALKKTVQSVKAQTEKDVEILIKDGFSTDGSVDEFENDESVTLYRIKDSSIYDAMNQAVEKATGDYYIFMNAGDSFADSKVLTRVKKKIVQSGADIIYGDMIRLGQNTVIPYPSKLTDFGCFRNVPCHQTCFYKKTLFEKRAYETSYAVRADYEHFLWCIYGLKATCSHIELPICIYEGDGFSETKENKKRSDIEHKQITKKYLGNKVYLYRFVMIITLQPVRRMLADSKLFSGIYQGIKRMVYGKNSKS